MEENTIAEFLSGDLDWCISNVESLFEQIYNQINDYTLQKYNTRIEIPSFGWKGYGVGIKGAVKAELQAQVLNFGSAMAVSLGRALMNRAYSHMDSSIQRRGCVRHDYVLSGSTLFRQPAVFG